MPTNQKSSNSFVPLQTVQGIDLGEFCNTLSGKMLIIWGAGHQGRVLQRAFERVGYINTAFCDNNTLLYNQAINGKYVFQPQTAIELAKAKKAILILANFQHLSTLKHTCQDSGLKEHQDFHTYLQLRRQEAVIEITDSRSEHRMLFSAYRNVLDKLLRDIPNLLHIDLNGWGDPLLNPDLPKIVKYTETFISCTVTTRIPQNCNIEPVLESKPSQFLFTLSDSDMFLTNLNQEFNWEGIKKPLLQISIQQQKTKDTEFRVLLARKRNHNAYQISKLQDLCEDLSLRLIVSNSYPSSYESFLNYSSINSSDNESSLTSINWDLDLALSLAKKDSHLPCLCQRIFPIIDASQRVNICHLYQDAILSNEYLSSNYSNLLNQRRDNEHCRLCQSQALHRLDIDILQRRNNINLEL